MDTIPLVDLSIQNQEVAEEVQAGITEVIKDSSFILGPAVSEFESAFAHYSEVKHCFGVANGGDALELMLRAFGIGAGDEVIVPANTFIATALSVLRAGATPVLVDCDPEYHLIDPEKVEAQIGNRTRAIIAVHLYGQIAPMRALSEIAKKSDLLLFEDAAQSQGARQNGCSVGGFGDAAATSFYPGKNLGAFGDAGAVFGNHALIAEAVPKLRDYGSDRKYNHPVIGFNSRLDTLQAVVLKVKLSRLDIWNGQRRIAAQRYESMLADCDGVSVPRVVPGNAHVWHLYVVRVHDRDRVIEALHADGIGAGIHYPKPIHLQGAFAHQGLRKGSFPNAEKSANEVLSLPIFPGISEDQQARVVDSLRRAVR